MKLSVIYTLDDGEGAREAEIELTLASPSPSVGVLGPYIEDMAGTYLDDDTKVDPKLLERYYDRLLDLACDRYYEEE